MESEGAYFFCISNIASFLLDELKQVGRQSVRCELVGAEEALGEQKQEEIRAPVVWPPLSALRFVRQESFRRN